MADFNFYINRQGIQGRKGDKGERGYTPSISINTDTLNEYTLDIANEFNTFTTPNLRSERQITDNGGTYIRFDRETQSLSAGGLDAATINDIGGVRLSSDTDITEMSESTVMTPSDVSDCLSEYLVSTDGQILIAQNQENSKTELTLKVDTSAIDNKIAAVEGKVNGNTEDITNLTDLVTENITDINNLNATVTSNTNSITNINNSIELINTNKQGKLTAGENITISADNVISATGGNVGDVTAAGDNTFTGHNKFTEICHFDGENNLRVSKNFNYRVVANCRVNEKLPKDNGTALNAYLGIGTDYDATVLESGANTFVKYYDLELRKDVASQLFHAHNLVGGENVTINQNPDTGKYEISSTGGTTIDDTTPSATSTYSSSKIDSLIGDVGTVLDNINGEVI